MRMRLRSEVALALAVKAAALTVLYLLFFAPAHRPDISAAVVTQYFYATPSQGVVR